MAVEEDVTTAWKVALGHAQGIQGDADQGHHGHGKQPAVGEFHEGQVEPVNCHKVDSGQQGATDGESGEDGGTQQPELGAAELFPHGEVDGDHTEQIAQQ